MKYSFLGEIYGVDYFFAALKENHITCEELNLTQSNWTMKACLAMMKIVKPTKVILKSENHDRYESVFLYKSLVGILLVFSYFNTFEKSGKMELDVDTVITSIAKLLSTFEDIEIRVGTNSDHYRLLRVILKVSRGLAF